MASPTVIIFIGGLLIILIVGVSVFFLTKAVFTKPPPQPPYETCGVNKKCPVGTFCSGVGYCLPKGTCAVDTDCTDSICLGGYCVSPSCKVDGDCGPRGICRDGQCEATCKNSNDCPGTQACLSTECVEKHCLLQADCAFDEACTTKAPTYGGIENPRLTQPTELGVCVKGLNPCVTDKDCSSPLVCSSGICVQCKESADCGYNLVCKGGLCLNPEQTLCPKDTVLKRGCLKNKACIPYPQCCPTSCRGDRLCKRTEDCPPDCPYCVGGECVCKPAPALPTGNTCTSNKDCGDGLVCWEGSCVKDFRCKPAFLIPHCYTDEICKIGRLRCDLRTNCCEPGPEGVRCETSPECGTLFCVNGFCSSRPGSYGDRCESDRDCESGTSCDINRSVPICVPL